MSPWLFPVSFQVAARDPLRLKNCTKSEPGPPLGSFGAHAVKLNGSPVTQIQPLYAPIQGPYGGTFQTASLLIRENTKSFSADEVIVARYPPAATAALLAEVQLISFVTTTGS